MHHAKPSKLKYIGAWIFFVFTLKIITMIIGPAFHDIIIKNVNNFNVYWILSEALSLIITFGSFILTYNCFDYLNIRKVIPYVYIFTGFFGSFFGVYQMKKVYDDLGVNLGVYYLIPIASAICTVCLIRIYYIKKPNRWY